MASLKSRSRTHRNAAPPLRAEPRHTAGDQSASALGDLSMARAAGGKLAEAEQLFRRRLAREEKARGADHPEVAICLTHLAALYYRQGRYAAAEPLLLRALAIDEKALGAEHPEVAVDRNNLAALYIQQGRLTAAEPLLLRALEIQEETVGSDHPDRAASLNNLGFLYQQQGRYPEAEPLLEQALAIQEAALGSGHPQVTTLLNNLASLYQAAGKEAAAESLYQRALAIREATLGPNHPDVATVLENYAALLLPVLRARLASEMRSRAAAIRAQHAEDRESEEAFAVLATPPVGSAGSARKGTLPHVPPEPPSWSPAEPEARASVAPAIVEPDPLPPTIPSLAREVCLEITTEPSGGPGGLSQAGAPDPHRSRLPAPPPLREEELRQALNRWEFEVYYQPLVSLETGMISGAETLLRWPHPQRGLLSPVDFIPLAKETGLILTLGEQLLRAACTQTKAWHEAGFPHLRLLVNLSEREILDPKLAERVLAVLHGTGMTASALQLEIPEDLARERRPLPAIRTLSTLGVRIAIDRFQSDPSGWDALKSWPAASVKLDRPLLLPIATDPQAAERTAAVISGAHALDWTVIALGVETEAQVALLRRQRCDEIQGHLLSPAAPADAFTQLLASGSLLLRG